MTTTGAAGQASQERPVDNLHSLHPSALRDRIPAAGLKEYWYPAIQAAKVSRSRPAKVKLLDTELALFRGKHGDVVTVSSACPHRGADLGRGRCHFSGTVTCPYHGWTFDEAGKCVAVLGEGPESRIPGMPEAKVRSYPTQTHKGIVFVWMGDSEPVDITEDVPPQFFEGDALVQHSVTTWNCNWRPAFENLLDAHVFYVHRSSVHLLLLPVKNLLVMSKMGPRRPRPRVVNGRGLMYRPGDLAFLSAFTGGGDSDAATPSSNGDKQRTWPSNDLQEAYPGLGGALWPKSARRLYWHQFVDLVNKVRRPKKHQPMVTDPEWHDAHLPAIYQVDYGDHIYTRMTVPIDKETSRIFYFHTTRPADRKRELWDRAYFTVFQNWMMNYNFSGQDADVVEYQYYDRPELFSATDTFPLTLRRFILEHGRDFLRAGDTEPSQSEARQ
jgi:phenylpropionate dioxygenase-like ring-hydroxylating dioxygenase large terminal subunit